MRVRSILNSILAPKLWSRTTPTQTPNSSLADNLQKYPSLVVIIHRDFEVDPFGTALNLFGYRYLGNGYSLKPAVYVPRLFPGLVKVAPFSGYGDLRLFHSMHSCERSGFVRSFSSPLSLSTRCVGKVRLMSTLPNGERENITDADVDGADKLYHIVLDYSHPEHKMEEALQIAGLELTTPMVLEVLQRLRYEEKLAFRFFTWAGHQENYSHEPRVYNEMIDILSSTKYKVKQFRIVCDLLDYMKRNNKTSVPIEVLVKVLRQYTEKHLTHLQKLTKKKKVRVKTQPEINAFNLLLDALCKCSLVEDAEAMVRRVNTKIKPIADTFNILFFGWCRVRNPVRAMNILEEMKKMGFTPDNFTYNTAIDTFCRVGMITEALDFLEFMRTKGSTMSSPTAKTYSIIILALVQTDMMEECSKVLKDMITSGCLPDVTTYKEVIEGMCLAGKVEAAYTFMEEMRNKGYPPDIVTLNCFLRVFCDNKDKNEATMLYQKMLDMGCVPSVQTYNMLISMFFRIGDMDGAFETWDKMERRGCTRDVDTYCAMIEGLFNSDRAKDACSLLEEVVHRGMKLPYQKFDSFLMKLSAIGDLQTIHRLSDHMRRFYNPAMARRFALNQKRRSVSLRGK